jgi:formylglycine-generating enzyme required for sulfatase activity
MRASTATTGDVERSTVFSPPLPRPTAVPRLEAMIHIPAGPYRKGLTTAQIDMVVERTKRQGFAVDLDSVRKVLRAEKVEQVHVDAFFIDPVPVTNREFERFVSETNHRTEAERRGNPENWREYFLDHDKAEHPVVCVSYEDAEAYCQWAGKRLPTADEWKKAFRGTEGRMYPWGDDYDEDKCNTAESCAGWQTTPVRKFPAGASVYGCLDMLGNVEEWTSTNEGPKKMVFGGSWSMTCEVYGLPVVYRVAARSFYSNDLGFRCAASDNANR